MIFFLFTAIYITFKYFLINILEQKECILLQWWSTEQYKQHIYTHIYVCMYVCVYIYNDKEKSAESKITVLRIFAFYSNYGSSVNIYQGSIIPV